MGLTHMEYWKSKLSWLKTRAVEISVWKIRQRTTGNVLGCLNEKNQVKNYSEVELLAKEWKNWWFWWFDWNIIKRVLINDWNITYINASNNVFNLNDIDIKNFNSLKRSEESKVFLGENPKYKLNYKPKYKILLNDWKIFYITEKMKANSWYEEIVWYIFHNGKLELRLFYKSNSEQVWRSCPWMNKWKLSKWEKIENYSYETTTKVDSFLWHTFDWLKLIDAKDLNPIQWDSLRCFWNNFLHDKMIEETEVTPLFSDNVVWNALIWEIDNDLSHDIKDKDIYGDLIAFKEWCINQKKNWGIVHSWMLRMSCFVGKSVDKLWENNVRYRDLESVSRMYGKLVPTWLDYQHMEPLREETYWYNHQFLWNVQTDVFKCNWNWRPLKIYFSRAMDDESLVRIDNITDFYWKINSFWIQEKWINASPLIAKPVDYIDQTPYWGWDIPDDVWNRFDVNDDGEPDYVDIRDLYQNNPIIKHYKKIRWLK